MVKKDFHDQAVRIVLEQLNETISYQNKYDRKGQVPMPYKTVEDFTAYDWKEVSQLTEGIVISSLAHDYCTEWRAGDTPRHDDYLEYEEALVSIQNNEGDDVSVRLLACPTIMKQCFKCKDKMYGYEIMDDLYQQKKYLRGCTTWDEFAEEHNLPIGFQKNYQFEKKKGWVCTEAHKSTYHEAYESQPAWYKDELIRADGFYPSPRADY